MAKKRKVITEDEVPPEEMTIPNNADVDRVVKRLASMQRSVQSASGEMGEYVNKICEEKDFDKRALGIARRLHALPDEKFRITWKHLLAYAGALDFDQRAEQQPEMFDVEIPEPAAENVRQLRAPRQLEADAG